ncbi:ferredoxin reductase family protein [Catellatospora sp. KI3]|uniref:ferredoxin reductase family protein n=1 Tax=Catellatospora sp. KI3 TaxID=3041620 RepID=UPI00248298F1|nr:ferredoxin reductase family protein [Catellatospora sp. KI3]MDI1466225.1 ferredoxin reductase family protein [Catellatospora sp. KI3]
MTRPLDSAGRARALTAFAGAATLGVTCALWFDRGGLGDLAGQPYLSTGRLTGLLAANLLLLQVFTMARVPWLERAWGQDRLARWHRLTGFASVWLMLAHLALITVGYGATSDAGVARRFVELVLTYPGMLLAAAGAGLLLAVVVLSVRAARRRLRYENWHLLHLYAYLGIGLALPHQLWNGTEFATGAPARAYWWTLYLAAAACVLLFRLALPWWRSRRHRLRVDRVRHEASDVYSVYLTGRDLDRLAARPGQFLLWRLRTGRGWTRAHPFSLSEAPRPDRLRFTFRSGGDDGARLAAAAPGTAVLVEGPFGMLTEARGRGGAVLLMAAGIGITPMRALLEGMAVGGELTLIYRARTERELVLRAELDEIAARRGARVIYLPGSPPPGRVSCLTAELAARADHEVLADLVPGLAERDVFLCGPPPWMDAARAALRAAGVPARRVHSERFGW